MQNTYYDQICRGENVRAALISLKNELVNEEARRQFAYLLAGDFRVLTGLLKHEDPKVRKNAACILGLMETEDVLPFLFDAWENEETRYVRPAYLEAMKSLNVSRYLDRLRARLRELEDTEIDLSNAKHVRQELSELRSLLMRYASSRYVWREDAKLPPVILVTGRFMAPAAAQKIKTGQAQVRGGGVLVTEGSWQEIGQIRIWSELLIPFSVGGVLPADPLKAAEDIVRLHIPELLSSMHEGSGAWRYRLEIKGVPAGYDKGRFIRMAAQQLDLLSKGELVNAPDNYQVTLRLLLRKDGAFSLFVKPDLFPDQRFHYRREWIADSLSPVNAAAIIEAARPYLTDGARVLDPFCGVGTLLTERAYCGSVDTAYGTDIFGEAIEKARINAGIAHMPIHYVQRDAFTFEHEYPFDEVITDLPRSIGGETAEVRRYLTAFLNKAQMWLKEEGVLVVYSRMGDAVKDVLCSSKSFRLVKTVVLNEKQNAVVVVARRTF